MDNEWTLNRWDEGPQTERVHAWPDRLQFVPSQLICSGPLRLETGFRSSEEAPILVLQVFLASVYRLPKRSPLGY